MHLFSLRGSANADDGIDSFLTLGALNSNASDECTSIGVDEGYGRLCLSTLL